LITESGVENHPVEASTDMEPGMKQCIFQQLEKKPVKKKKSKKTTETHMNDEANINAMDPESGMYIVEMESKFTYAVAALLAGASGAVDAIAFSMFGCFVANQSGNVIQVGMRSAGNTPGSPWVAAQLVGSFMLGCMICGMLIPKRRPKFPVGDDLYTIAFFLNAIFLIFAAYAKNTVYGQFLGCIACGLMNSITTSWSDGPMRTTHATGPSTEVGLNLGRIIALLIVPDVDFDKADMRACVRKFRLNAVLVFSFMVGGYAGSMLYSQIGGDALLLPASISIGVAVLNLALPAIEVTPAINCVASTKGRALSEPLLTAVSAGDSDFNRCEHFGYKKKSVAKSVKGKKGKEGSALPMFVEDDCDSDGSTTIAASSNFPSCSTLAASSNYPSAVSVKDGRDSVLAASSNYPSAVSVKDGRDAATV
jgi:uncharacterized membrane protein YoaK (UPF0700 family)